MLPVQPGVTEFMGENIAAARHGEAFADIDGLGAVVPDPIGIGIAFIHFSIGELSYRDVIAKREHDFRGNAHHGFLFFE